MSLDTLIINAFDEWLKGEVTPERVRQIDLGESADSLWRSLDEHGFADLLLPEEHGGAAANAMTACQLLVAAGSAALPLPLASTWWGRYALSEANLAIPDGPITLATGRREGAAIACYRVPYATSAQWVLATLAEGTWLLPISADQRRSVGVHATQALDLSWPVLPENARRLPLGRNWTVLGAAFSAALIAGASEKILHLTLEYANTRQQFGKSIASMQAIQQQVSVLAEEVAATRIAAQLALRNEIWPPAIASAVGKARNSAAAVRICTIAHAVIGAIGISEEFDLQLLTRRLYEWRADYGSESTWHAFIGQSALEGTGSCLEFMEQHLPTL